MTTPATSEILNRLKLAEVPYSTDDENLFAASIDHTRFSALPIVAVYAKRVDHIGTVLEIANELGQPVTVRGAGTGCSAGAVPFCGGIVLDLSALNFIEIDPVSRTAHVGAGAVNADVDNAADKFGLFYAPDPSSHKFSTIGGNIACNAGGLRAAKYGVTRDNVLALTAFLADGKKIKCGLPLKKFSAGANLRDLFIGSEGQFGVVAEAWLKLLPKPQNKAVSVAFFKDDNTGFEAVEKIMRSKLSPSILEFMDVDTVECVRKKEPTLQIPEAKCALAAQFDTADANEDAREFARILNDLSQGETRFTRDDAEAEKLWKIRRAASPAMYILGDSKIGEDIVLPFSKVAEFFKFFKSLGRKNGFPAPVFGHAADGNYHIHFMYNSAADNRKRALYAMDKAMEKVVELGGAVSGEHGIGALKSKFMPLQHSPEELDLMKKIKDVLDPKHILNRGKVLTPFDLQNVAPLTNIKLPWD